MSNKLTAKQASFVENYADPNSETFNNATQSAIKAGYKPKYAATNTNQITNNNCVIEGIKVFVAEIKKKTVATRAKRQQFWTSTMDDAKSNMGDRLRASELLGKSEADFIEIHKDVTDQQKELTETEATEAKRLASIRLRQGA